MSQEGDQDAPSFTLTGSIVVAGATVEPVPRPPRLQISGGVFHVTARGNRKQPIFYDDSDCSLLLNLLGGIVSRFRWRCHAYCLMPNHFHLLIETPEESLSTGMQRLNSRYAQSFNHRYELTGHVFQGRFHSVLVEGAAHVVTLARYLALNPVRAGLCRHAEAWKWSSYPSTIGLTTPPRFLTCGWLLSQFGNDPQRARAALRELIADTESASNVDSPAMSGVRPRTWLL